jgi:hypothetical protein
LDLVEKLKESFLWARSEELTHGGPQRSISMEEHARYLAIMGAYGEANGWEVAESLQPKDESRFDSALVA